MSLDADTIVDRRRMRRKLTFWRALAVVLVIGGIIALAAIATGPGRGIDALTHAGGYVARINIQGLIRNDQERVESLARLGRSSAARAVIVHIDSPGGTTAGSEQLHDALREVAKRKPVVVVVDGLAASGGYIAAMAADHIIAQGSSLVGSIGVLFQYPNVTELLKTVGVKVEEIKSSPLKAAPNGFEPTSPEARAALEAIVRDSYAWFRGMVGDRRHLDEPLLEQVSDGRVFTGRQALALRLVDQLGNETTARAWLAKEKKIAADTPVRDWQLRSRLGDLSMIHLAASVLKLVGLDALARQLEESATMQALERLNLDGLLALWHPSAVN
jgi:protease-4